jgi:hypothetical protein
MWRQAILCLDDRCLGELQMIPDLRGKGLQQLTGLVTGILDAKIWLGSSCYALLPEIYPSSKVPCRDPKCVCDLVSLE